MYAMRLSQDTKGTAAGMDIAGATFGGVDHEARSRNGATMALARKMVAAGAPDDRWRALRNGVTVMFGPSLHRLAMLTIADPDNGRMSIRRWTAYVPAAASS